MTMKLIAALCALLPPVVLAADLQTCWTAVTTDDAGAELPGPVAEYRVYPCGSDTPVAVACLGDHTADRCTHQVDETCALEPDEVTGTGTFCREVVAYLSPFEGKRAQGTVIVVIPGATGTVNVQALQ